MFKIIVNRVGASNGSSSHLGTTLSGWEDFGLDLAVTAAVLTEPDAFSSVAATTFLARLGGTDSAQKYQKAP